MSIELLEQNLYQLVFALLYNISIYEMLFKGRWWVKNKILRANVTFYYVICPLIYSAHKCAFQLLGQRGSIRKFHKIFYLVLLFYWIKMSMYIWKNI